MHEMNARERVIRAMNFEATDRLFLGPELGHRYQRAERLFAHRQGVVGDIDPLPCGPARLRAAVLDGDLRLRVGRLGVELPFEGVTRRWRGIPRGRIVELPMENFSPPVNLVASLTESLGQGHHIRQTVAHRRHQIVDAGRVGSRAREQAHPRGMAVCLLGVALRVWLRAAHKPVEVRRDRMRVAHRGDRRTQVVNRKKKHVRPGGVGPASGIFGGGFSAGDHARHRCEKEGSRESGKNGTRGTRSHHFKKIREALPGNRGRALR